MKFFDEVNVYFQAGDGGNGSSSFRRVKYVPRGGPDGGNGGDGGNIVLVAKDNLNTLVYFHYQVHHRAESGKSGSGQNRTGASGDDLIIGVPIGTQVFDEHGELLIYDLDKKDKTFIVTKGGHGGVGNTVFKTSTNRTPESGKPGHQGEFGWFTLKLKLISDVGLIGVPNAGKSSILSTITNARPKIADYPFTTLSPMLGVVRRGAGSFVVCDIPGLLEGAHNGVGLGDVFLKHIERCKVLVHIIDCSQDDIVEVYRKIRTELKMYDKSILKKKEIIVFNKIDIVSEKDLKKKISEFKRKTKKVPFAISTATTAGLKELIYEIFAVLRNETDR